MPLPTPTPRQLIIPKAVSRLSHLSRKSLQSTLPKRVTVVKPAHYFANIRSSYPPIQLHTVVLGTAAYFGFVYLARLIAAKHAQHKKLSAKTQAS